MSDPTNPLRLEVVGVMRNGRRRYDPASKQRLVETCLQPNVSLSSLALQHGVNANLLRKWVAEHQRQQRNGASAGATDVFVPVVALRDVAGPAEPPVPAPPQHPDHRAKAARQPDPPAPRLTAEMPNGVTLRLECSGQDVALVSVMILTLGRCDVPAGR